VRERERKREGERGKGKALRRVAAEGYDMDIMQTEEIDR
jgi:hypothetical protein